MRPIHDLRQLADHLCNLLLTVVVGTPLSACFYEFSCGIGVLNVQNGVFLDLNTMATFVLGIYQVRLVDPGQFFVTANLALTIV